jgi:FG-GAP-like repeat
MFPYTSPSNLFRAALCVGTIATFTTRSWAQLGPEHRFLYEPHAWALALADVDGDGDGDVLQVQGDHLYVRSQVAPDQFEVTADLGATGRAYRVLLTDLDGDGTVDVVLPRFEYDAISWFHGLGGGQFAAMQNLVTGIVEPLELQVADMDGDSDTDLIFAHDSLSYDVSWAANEGGGVFGPPAIITATSNHWWGTIFRPFDIADMDLNGTMDVVVRANSEFIWFDNDGGGAFTSIPLGFTANDFVLADMDSDGDPDLVTGSDLIGLHENDGSGILALAAQPMTAPNCCPSYCYMLQATDLEMDGDMDVVYWLKGGFTTTFINCARNVGGDLLAVEDWGVLADQQQPLSLGYSSENGLMDLVVRANEGLYLVRDANTQPLLRLTSVQHPASLAVADLDGNGATDVLISGLHIFSPTEKGFEPLQGGWHMNPGDGLLIEQQPNIVLQAPAPVRRMIPADLDGDGDQDLLMMSRHPQLFTDITWTSWRNDGSAFTLIDTLASHNDPFRGDVQVLIPEVRDVDSDGDLDVVTTFKGMALSPPPPVQLFKNEGGGTFQPPNYLTQFPSYPPIEAVALCDVDNDGDPDYLWGHLGPLNGPDSMFMNVNPGDGIPVVTQFMGMTINECYYESNAYYPDENAPLRRATDINLDGLEDLLDFNGDSILVKYNTGGNFINAQLLPMVSTTAYDVGDMNMDGLPDITALLQNGDILFWPQQIGGTFAGPFTLITSSEHSGRTDLKLADMDSDGDLDVVTCANTGAAAWLGNNGDLPTSITSGVITNASFTVAPVPFHDRTRLLAKAPFGPHTFVQVIDVQGRVVRVQQAAAQQREVVIERGDLRSGMYLVKLTDEHGVIGMARVVVE